MRTLSPSVSLFEASVEQTPGRRSASRSLSTRSWTASALNVTAEISCASTVVSLVMLCVVLFSAASCDGIGEAPPAGEQLTGFLSPAGAPTVGETFAVSGTAADGFVTTKTLRSNCDARTSSDLGGSDVATVSPATCRMEVAVDDDVLTVFVETHADDVADVAAVIG
eukprot:scaffold289547_cov28-Tisochrysis_lutea.AAC.1